MKEKRLSILIVILMVLQSLTVVVEAHAFEQFEAATSAHDALHSNTVHPDGQDSPLDHVLHCPHHGCHSPFFVSIGISLPVVTTVSLIDYSFAGFKPDAPVSSLYRPPRI